MININALKVSSKEIRKNILRMTTEAKSGHIAGPLGISDLFSYLYFYRFIEKETVPLVDIPLILSCAHYAPVLYSTLILKGVIPEGEIHNLRKFGSILQGHTKRNPKYGIYNSGGSLGHGLGLACGMAISNREKNVYCVISDGETNEGSIWEAAMFASKYKLTNLYVLLDRNGIQQSGTSNQQMPLLNLEEKWNAFGFETEKANGNDFLSLHNAFENLGNSKNNPKIIISYTTPGYGYGKIENNFKWHGKVLDETELAEALLEIDSKI